MLVYVLNKEGKPLMPSKPSKARKLLKLGIILNKSENIIDKSIKLRY